MKLIKTTLLFLISFFIINSSTAQNNGLILQSQPPVTIEKLYLQTDRDFYFLGDTIWFKAYLLDGQSLSPVSDIQNLYVELINSQGRITQNQVSLCEYGLASGNITISDTSNTGPVVIMAICGFIITGIALVIFVLSVIPGHKELLDELKVSINILGVTIILQLFPLMYVR